MKKHHLYLLVLILLMLTGTARADDTEIYLNPANAGGHPLVMFYIEYTPNMASTVCTNVSADMSADEWTAACSSVSNSFRKYLTANDFEDSKLDQFELTRASLKRVLYPLGGGGLKVGLLMPHASNANCAGPGATGCSGGGYILKGLTPLAAPSDVVSETILTHFSTQATVSTLETILNADAGKRALFAKLDELRSPQGGYSHPSQLKELYFELFRYLTGQGVYDGHNGWNDFGTSSTYNLGTIGASNGYHYDYNCITGNQADCLPPPTGTTNEFSHDPGAGFWAGDFAVLPNGNYMSTLPFKWDTSVEDGSGNYNTPFNDNCQRVYVVNMVDGGGTGQNDADAAIEAETGAGGMGLTNLANNDPGFVQMVGWLNDIDLADGSLGNAPDYLDKQNVESYFIAKQPQQVNDAAIAGGTRRAYALQENPDEVVQKLTDILNQILSTSTTFVSASIPVNVFNRSEVLDNVFVALFKTDENHHIAWYGNIKKLKLGFDSTGSLDVFDVSDHTNSAIDPASGRIRYDALTYWTNANGYDVQTANLANYEVAGKDGRSIKRGGAGQQIPNFLDASGGQGSVNLTNVSGGRQLFTLDDQSGTTQIVSLDMSNMGVIWPHLYVSSEWSNATDAANMDGTWSNDKDQAYDTIPCGTYFSDYTTLTNYHSSDTDSDGYTDCTVHDMAANIMAYIRGKDVYGTNTDGNPDLSTLQKQDYSRRWLFGDPLHSRPLPINYGARSGFSNTNPDIRLLVGSNDGFLRMIQNIQSDGSQLGKENWAFMPTESLAIQKRLMENDQGSNHPYGVDGAPVAYVLDNNHDGTISTGDGDKVWVFFGLRRGGKAYYALDISNPDTTPTFMWKIDNNTSGFGELGLTFSTPKVAMLKWGANTDPKPVLIFGGGYDTNKDTPDVIGTDDSEGNAIYVVDAETGALVWKAVKGDSITPGDTTFTHPDLDDSIPSPMTVVDTTGDGNADRAYVGDTGGTVWRVDFSDTVRSHWVLTKVLVAGRHYNSSLADDRRFFHAPDFVPARDQDGNRAPFDGVVIGSGNRAHPQGLLTTDYMYMIKDRNITPLSAGVTDTWLLHDSDTASETLQDVTSDCLQYSNCSDSFDLSNGWKMQLDFDTGEKSLASPYTLAGEIYFNTFVPNPDPTDPAGCGPTEGRGLSYRVSLYNANSVYNYDSTSGGTDSSGDATELGKTDRYRLLDSAGIPSENVYISYRETDPTTGVSQKATCTMTPDFTCEESGTNAAWRTYWYKKEE